MQLSTVVNSRQVGPLALPLAYAITREIPVLGHTSEHEHSDPVNPVHF